MHKKIFKDDYRISNHHLWEKGRGVKSNLVIIKGIKQKQDFWENCMGIWFVKPKDKTMLTEGDRKWEIWVIMRG